MTALSKPFGSENGLHVDIERENAAAAAGK
jgi:hypothetical protein